MMRALCQQRLACSALVDIGSHAKFCLYTVLVVAVVRVHVQSERAESLPL